MEDLYRSKLEKIASRHQIDSNIIIGLVNELTIFNDYLHDSFEGFKNLPYPKWDDMPWSRDPKGWAELSLFYHNNKSNIDEGFRNIFKGVKLKLIDRKESLELTEFVVNDIMKSYFGKIVDENLLLNKATAERITEFKKSGKQPIDENKKRDEMVKLSASYLKRNGINRGYTLIVIEVLMLFGYYNLSKGYIREIVSMSK